MNCIAVLLMLFSHSYIFEGQELEFYVGKLMAAKGSKHQAAFFELVRIGYVASREHPVTLRVKRGKRRRNPAPASRQSGACSRSKGLLPKGDSSALARRSEMDRAGNPILSYPILPPHRRYYP